MKKIFFIAIVAALFSTGCNLNSMYEKNVEIPQFNWDYQFVPSFQVNIEDTVSYYNLSMNIRHLDNYPYMNMWIQLHGNGPDGKQQKERIPIGLATNEGKWLGNGLNGVWMYNVLLKQKIRFPHKGLYTFGIEHDMRINPLPSIMNIGLKLEKNKI